MANATRYSTSELAELESRIASAAERALTLELELFEELCRAVLAEAERDRPDRAGARPPRRRRRPRRARRGAALLPPRDRRRRRLRDPGRPPPGGRAGARARGHAVHRQRRRPVGAPAPVAADRAEHGRQEHVLAPERADRDPRPGGQLRARRARPHRRGRPPVLARRRGRRSGARPLDLHGRDGRDRGDPQPGDAAGAS